MKQAVALLPSYVGVHGLYLETADRRIVGNPYSPQCPDAIGKVFRLEKGVMREFVALHTSFVKSIAPMIFDRNVGDEVPIKVYADVTAEKERVLLARIEYIHNTRLVDTKKRDGTWLLLVLYLQ